MGGSYTSIVRQTKQNAATLGVSLVVLGPLLGSLWPRVCDIPILDLDEVGESKKRLYLRIFLREGHILLSEKGPVYSVQSNLVITDFTKANIIDEN